MSPKVGFLDLPGELRNQIYSLLTPRAVCDIVDTERIRRNILSHPITATHKTIAAEWSSIAFQNITFFVRAKFERRGRRAVEENLTRENHEKDWDEWLRSLIASQVASIKRIIFYMQDFKVDVNVARKRTEGQRRIRFKISGFANGLTISLHKHLADCFETIEGGDERLGKKALTGVRDAVFDAQEDFQRFIDKRQKRDDDLGMMAFDRTTFLGLGAWR